MPRRNINRFGFVVVTLLGLKISTSAQVTADNGLSASSNNVQLGGSLLQNTTIDLGDNNNLHFKKGSKYILSIMNNGNLGIGNSIPEARLSFPDAGNGEEASGISWSGSNYLYQFGIHRTAGPWSAPNYQQLRLGWVTGIILDPGVNNGKSYVDIQGNGLRVTQGNVGIGTTNPAGALHIMASPNDVGVVFNNSINGYSSMLWAANNVGFGLVSGGGLYAVTNAGLGLTVGTSASNTSAGGMFNIKGSGNNASSYSMKVQNSNAADLFTIRDDGNVGIGTVSPSASLHIVPNSASDGGVIFNNSINGYSSMLWASNNVGFGLVSGGGLIAVANSGYGLTIGTGASSTSPGGMFNIKAAGTTAATYSIKVQNSNAADIFTVRDDGFVGVDGNVGIGTTSIANYKLSVNGNIRSRKVRVDQDTWADYVFDNNYQLRSINELEQYIQTEKHLPDVPSAAEVKKEGLDLGDNQAVLLKKIEELTLYVIEQNKKNEELSRSVIDQDKRINEQQKLLQQQQLQIEDLKKNIGK